MRARNKAAAELAAAKAKVVQYYPRALASKLPQGWYVSFTGNPSDVTVAYYSSANAAWLAAAGAVRDHHEPANPVWAHLGNTNPTRPAVKVAPAKEEVIFFDDGLEVALAVLDAVNAGARAEGISSQDYFRRWLYS